MRTTTRSLTLAVILGISPGSNAQADLTLGLASLGGTDIEFKATGTSGSPASTISFTKSGGETFAITTSNSISQSAVGLQGNITGTYSYTSVTQISSTEQDATATGTGKLTIGDGNGKSLTGAISGINIEAVTNTTPGTITYSEQIYLSGVSYTDKKAPNADLTELANEASLDGGAILSISFTTSENLTTLGTKVKNGTNTYDLAYVGSLGIAPEPSTTVLAGLGALGLISYGLRRRKASGA